MLQAWKRSLPKYQKKVKTQKGELDALQVSFDELEQYTRKNSLELHGIPEDIDLPMDEIVAEAIGVELECDDVEIAHRLNRKKGNKPIIAKFVSHKNKSRLYKARVQLKDSTVPSVFLNYAGPITTDPPMRIFINENLTQYRKEMMSLALQKKNDQKITSAWSLDGKISLKTYSLWTTSENVFRGRYQGPLVGSNSAYQNTVKRKFPSTHQGRVGQ